MVLICTNTGEKHSLAGCVLDVCLVLVNSSDLQLTFWEECSDILISGSYLLKHWRATHSLDECSAILMSGSDLLKH